MAALRAALASASRGRGRLVLLSGEAGIGKTRLADAFAPKRGTTVPVSPGDGAGKRAARRSTGRGSRRCAHSCATSGRRPPTADRTRRPAYRPGPAGDPRCPPELPELPADDTDRARFQLFDSSRGCCGTPPATVRRPDPRRSPRRRRAIVAAAPLRVDGLGRHRSRGAGHLPRGELAPPTHGSACSPRSRACPRPSGSIRRGSRSTRWPLHRERPPRSAARRSGRGRPSRDRGKPFVGEIVRLLAEEGRLGRPPDIAGQPLGVTEGVRP